MGQQRQGKTNLRLMFADGSRPDRTRLRCAFSLVELIMVLTIIGVVASIALPRFGSSLARYRVEAAAQRVIADMAFAQERARQRSQAQRIEYFQDKVFYQLPGVPGIANPVDTYTVELNAEPYRVTLKANFDGSTTLEFDGYGSRSATLPQAARTP